MARLVFHIDVNSAFLSWEATRRVSLGEEDRICRSDLHSLHLPCLHTHSGLHRS